MLRRMIGDALGDSLPGYELSSWYGIGAPSNTPPAVIETLNRAVNDVLAEPAFKAQIADLGGTTLPGSPGDFAALITTNSEKLGKVIQVAVKPGDDVKRGATLMVLEAMKMEHSIAAPMDGKIDRVFFKAGDLVEEGAELLAFVEEG